MKKLLLLLLCVPLIGFGQSWEKVFGGSDHDLGESVQQTTDGGYIICGGTQSFGNGGSDVYLIKTDFNGVQQWSQTFGGVSEDEGYSVQQTTDGGYIICGVTHSFGNGGFDVYLIKTDGSGVEQWNQTFGGSSNEIAVSVQQTADGGYIMCGYLEMSNGYESIYLIKTDINGIQQWSQNFGGADYDWGESVRQTTDGGYIVAGVMNESVCLIKTNANGIHQWTKTFGGTGSHGYSVQQTTDGGYIITGSTYISTGQALYLIKTDANGIEQWSQNYIGPQSGNEGEEGWSVEQTLDGGYIVSGQTLGQFGGTGQGYNDQVLLIKTNSQGDTTWTRRFGGPINAVGGGNEVHQTTDGGYIVCASLSGLSNGFGNYDILLIKTDGNGNITSEFTVRMISNRELEKLVDILGRDINPEKNKPFIEIYNDGTVEKRIIIE